MNVVRLLGRRSVQRDRNRPMDPPKNPSQPLLDLADTLSEQGYTTFLAALTAADMVFGGGPLTIMAPTNAAFEALGEDLLACLFAFENGRFQPKSHPSIPFQLQPQHSFKFSLRPQYFCHNQTI